MGLSLTSCGLVIKTRTLGNVPVDCHRYFSLVGSLGACAADLAPPVSMAVPALRRALSFTRFCVRGSSPDVTHPRRVTKLNWQRQETITSILEHFPLLLSARHTLLRLPARHFRQLCIVA